jgi:2-dehydro-3-deoxygluconokinase
MVKHVSAAGTRSQYYRAGSAASALGPEDLDRIDGAGWVHLTGITPALSPSAADLVHAIIEHRNGRVSFDVNYRAALWPDASTAVEILLPLGRRSEVVFIGDDEAELLFGTADADELVDLILRPDDDGGDRELVVKRGADGAVVMGLGEPVWVPGLAADLVDPTGAGDAFAAGYLAARRSGWPPADRLRLGHLLGSRVVGVLDDVPPAFSSDEMVELTLDRLRSRWADE